MCSLNYAIVSLGCYPNSFINLPASFIEFRMLSLCAFCLLHLRMMHTRLLLSLPVGIYPMLSLFFSCCIIMLHIVSLSVSIVALLFVLGTVCFVGIASYLVIKYIYYIDLRAYTSTAPSIQDWYHSEN